MPGSHTCDSMACCCSRHRVLEKLSLSNATQPLRKKDSLVTHSQSYSVIQYLARRKDFNSVNLRHEGSPTVMHENLKNIQMTRLPTLWLNLVIVRPSIQHLVQRKISVNNSPSPIKIWHSEKHLISSPFIISSVSQLSSSKFLTD